MRTSMFITSAFCDTIYHEIIHFQLTNLAYFGNRPSWSGRKRRNGFNRRAAYGWFVRNKCVVEILKNVQKSYVNEFRSIVKMIQNNQKSCPSEISFKVVNMLMQKTQICNFSSISHCWANAQKLQKYRVFCPQEQVKA